MIETSDMQFDSRMVTAEETPEDHDVEVTLRPQTLAEYIGQDKVKENMAIYIQAAKRRGDPLDHVLLYGPPGLGKTTLSAIIAHEMGVNLRVTTGPAIEKPGDLAALLTNLQPNDVLFIDEIHRLSRAVEEILYPALEDHAIDIIMGKGPSARSLRIDLNPFALLRHRRADVAGLHLAGRVHPRRVSRRFHRHGKKVRLWNISRHFSSAAQSAWSVRF